MDTRGVPDMYTAIGGNTYCMIILDSGSISVDLSVHSYKGNKNTIFLVTTIKIFRDVFKAIQYTTLH